jgi:hypothetical protein
MRTMRLVTASIALLVFCGFLAPTSVFCVDLGLVGLLTQKLGITEEQAKGGAGAIFNMAKQKLSTQDFGTVADAVPEMDDLLKAAPATGGLGGAIGGKMPSLGGSAQELGGLASLSGSFSGLGLQSDMANKFVPIILSYVESKGGGTAKNILASVLQ